MKEKRISLRFRTDNAQDMKVWQLLEEAARDKNASKNSIVIELLLIMLEHENSNDALAEHIAELVATKLSGAMIQCEARETTSTEKHDDTVESVLVSQADEPVVLGEDAVDLLDMFG